MSDSYTRSICLAINKLLNKELIQWVVACGIVFAFLSETVALLGFGLTDLGLTMAGKQNNNFGETDGIQTSSNKRSPQFQGTAKASL